MKQRQKVVHFADFNVSDLAHAVELEWDDFEDAVQSVTAERVHADYIIMRYVACTLLNGKF